MTRFGALDRLALRASLLDGSDGKRALVELLDRVDFNNARIGVWRLSPLLSARAKMHAVTHPLVKRIAGVARHTWLSNEIRMKSLPGFLDLVEAVSPAVLMKGGATLVRFGALGNLRPMGDLDILVREPLFRAVVATIGEAGWLPEGVAIDPDGEWPEATPGAPFKRSISEIYDLHWSPLHDVADPELSDTIIASAQAVVHGGRPMLVPAMHHHLAILLLHADQAVSEDAGRVDWACEAVLALDASGAQMDWRAFEAFARSYGLQERLADIVDDLSSALGRRIGARRPGFLPRPVLHLEQNLRASRDTRHPGVGVALLAFQRHRRSAGWRLDKFLGRGELLPALARAEFAVIERSRQPLETIARNARNWARRWRARGKLRPRFVAGWSWLEVTGGRWSDGRIAVIQLPSVQAQGGLVALRLAARPFVPWPGHPLTLHVDAGCGCQRILVTPLTRGITVPARVDGDGFVTAGFSFDLPERDPTHPDPRRLALFVSDINVASIDTRELPVELDLCAASRPAELGSGWSATESGGTWTDGHDAYLSIGVEPGFKTARLELELAGIAPGDGVSAAIALSGRWRQNARLDASARFIYQEVRPNDCVDGMLSVRVHIRNPRSPASQGLSADRRALGLRVRRIVLRKTVAIGD